MNDLLKLKLKIKLIFQLSMLTSNIMIPDFFTNYLGAEQQLKYDLLLTCAKRNVYYYFIRLL